MTNRNRIPYFDVLRGIAILGVVAIHSSGQILSLTADSFNLIFTLLWRQLFNFSVPLFLAISGFFMARHIINSSEEYFLFIKSRIERVYIPCMFWSFIAFLLTVFIFHKPFMENVYKMITFQSIIPYYFIALILQYYIFLPVLKYFANIKGLFISAIVSISMTLLLYYIKYYTNMNLPVIIYAGFFPTWLFFFVYGIYFGMGRNNYLNNRVIVLGIVFCYLFSCMESYFLYEKFQKFGDSTNAIKLSSFIYSFFVISFIFNNLSVFKINLLKKIGKISFGIYLIHIFIITAIFQYFKMVPVSIFMKLTYQFGLVIFTIFLCYVIIILSKMLFSKKLIKVIGF